MSVLACDRGNCDNIMCDRMSLDQRWYLCDRCFEELVQRGPATDLDEFMNGPPQQLENKEEASRAYFDTLFPLRFFG